MDIHTSSADALNFAIDFYHFELGKLKENLMQRS
jgi:hypothetical protein